MLIKEMNDDEEAVLCFSQKIGMAETQGNSKRLRRSKQEEFNKDFFGEN